MSDSDSAIPVVLKTEKDEIYFLPEEGKSPSCDQVFELILIT